MLEQLRDLNLCPASLAMTAEAEFGQARTPAWPQLAVLADAAGLALAGFESEGHTLAGKTLLLGPASPRNAAAVRPHLAWLRRQLLGLRPSAGLSDRLGAGHARPRARYARHGRLSGPHFRPAVGA